MTMPPAPALHMLPPPVPRRRILRAPRVRKSGERSRGRRKRRPENESEDPSVMHVAVAELLLVPLLLPLPVPALLRKALLHKAVAL